MPATFIEDTVEGSMVEIFGQAQSAVRTGIVYDLPTTGDSSAVLWHATTAINMPLSGSAHPASANCFLTRIQVYGVSADCARVKLIYEPFQGVSATSFLIEVGSSLSTYTTNLMPGTRTPIKVGWTPSAAGKAAGLEEIPPDLVSLQMLRPMRRVGVTQLQAGTLGVSEAALFGDCVGKVNKSKWMGRKPGAWIISSAGASISRYGGYYQRHIEAISQGKDIWSYFAVLKSQVTGKYATGGTGNDDIKAQTELLVNVGYVPGKIHTPDGNPAATKGVVRVDPYDWVEFDPLFGIADPPGFPTLDLIDFSQGGSGGGGIFGGGP